MIALWAGAQALWLKNAYDLEFLGKDVAFVVWNCSMIFLVVNCWEILEVLRNYRWERPVPVHSKKTQ